MSAEMEMVDRVRKLENYKASEKAQSRAWWHEQWKANSEIAQRLAKLDDEVRDLDRSRQRAIGAFAAAGFAGSVLGALVGGIL